jgi:hypothetical protein
MSIEKGDYVIATVPGSGTWARGYGRAGFREGEELLVTSVGASHLNVRRAAGGNVFRVRPDQMRPVTRPLGQVPEGGISPDDPRIAWIFEDAARLADRLGLCADFDRVADGLGIPGRMRIFTITFEPTEGVKLTAKVEARSRRQAEAKLRGSVQQQPPIKSIGARS